MMEETFSIERLAQAGQQEISGVVSVSLPPATAAHLVMPHLGKFYRQYPELQLRILGDVHYASLQHREADIAVRFGRPKDDYLIARKAGEVPFGIYAAKNIWMLYKKKTMGGLALKLVEFKDKNSKS